MSEPSWIGPLDSGQGEMRRFASMEMDPRAQVAASLVRAGLPAAPDEAEELARALPRLRGLTDTLYLPREGD